MMELGTHKFWEFSGKLEEMILHFLGSMATTPVSEGEKTVGAADVQPATGASEEAAATSACEAAGSVCDTETVESVADQSGLCADGGLDAATLWSIINEDCGNEREPSREAFNPEDYCGHEDCDEYEDADEEDFVDVDNIFHERDALSQDNLDMLAMFDMHVASLSSPVADLSGFSFNSPQPSTRDHPRFPSLPRDQSASRLEELMIDSDREDDFSVGSVAGAAFVEAVAFAVASGSQMSLETQVAMPSPLLSPRAPATAAASVSRFSLSPHTTSALRTDGGKRKGVDGEVPARKTPRVDVEAAAALQISAFLPAVRRGAPKQNSQLTLSGARCAAIVTLSTCPVSVEAFASVVQHAPLAEVEGLVQAYPVLYADSLFESRVVRIGRVHVDDTTPKVNFLITANVESRMRCAINDAKTTVSAPTLAEAAAVQARLRERGGFQFSITIEGMAQKLNEDDMLAIATVASVKQLHSRFKRDIDWLMDDWTWQKSRFAHPTPFLKEYGDECGGGASTEDPLGTNGMRSTIIAKLGSYGLQTTLTVPIMNASTVDVPAQRPPSVSLPEVLGRLSGTEWLNDSIVNFSLHLLASKYPGVSVVDSLTRAAPVAPPTFLVDQRLVVFPVNFKNSHWCLICVEFLWGKPSGTAYVYDPLGGSRYSAKLTETWDSWCLPLLKNWLERDKRRVLSGTNRTEQCSVTQLPRISWEAANVATPKQRDSFSCGVYCIAHALCYMTEDFAMHEFSTFSPSRLQVMRLRIMFMILTKASVCVDEEARRAGEEYKKSFISFAKLATPGGVVRESGRRRARRTPKSVT